MPWVSKRRLLKRIDDLEVEVHFHRDTEHFYINKANETRSERVKGALDLIDALASACGLKRKSVPSSPSYIRYCKRENI